MAVNPFILAADITETIIPETSFAQTPTSGAQRYELPVKVDTAPLAYKIEDIKSDTKRIKRAAGGTKPGMGTASGTWEFRFSKAEVLKPLLESALSGKFTNGVLKAGDTDSTFTHIAKLAADKYEITPGCICNSVTIAGKMNAGITASFAVTGAGRTTSDTDNQLAVQTTGVVDEWVGKEVSSIKVGDADLTYTEFSLVGNHTKTALGAFGTRNALGYGVSGAREVILTLKAYKTDFSLDNLVNAGEPTNAVITIGDVGDGYKITLPLADINWPEGSVDNGALVQTVVLTARLDEATTTDLMIEAL